MVRSAVKSPTKVVRLALVDDHSIVREPLAAMIDRDMPGYRVVLQAGNGVELIAALEGRDDIDIALIDLCMPVMDGFETLAWLEKHRPEIKTLVLTFDASEDALKRALGCGACGHVLKASDPSVLRNALDQVRDNGWYHTDAAFQALRSGDLRTALEKERDEQMAKITEQELRVILVGCSEKDLPNKLVADELQLKLHTVVTYFKRIHKKLGIRSRTMLLRKMIKWGIVKP